MNWHHEKPQTLNALCETETSHCNQPRIAPLHTEVCLARVLIILGKTYLATIQTSLHFGDPVPPPKKKKCTTPQIALQLY